MAARMEALIKEVQARLSETDEFYRSRGLDPEKVRTMLEDNPDARWAAEARAAIEADMAAIEQEVAEEKARADFAQATTNLPRGPASLGKSSHS